MKLLLAIGVLGFSLTAFSFGFENKDEFNTLWTCFAKAGAQVKSNRKSGKLEATNLDMKDQAQRPLRVNLFVYPNGTTGNQVKVNFPNGKEAIFREFMERTYLHKRRSKVAEIWRIHQGTWKEKGKRKQLLTITSNLIFPQNNVNTSLIFGHMSLYECQWTAHYK